LKHISAQQSSHRMVTPFFYLPTALAWKCFRMNECRSLNLVTYVADHVSQLAFCNLK